ncbi:GtrA family protein [Sphingobium aromaticiconvertens]|uniref:GtrA family protein n=1 Tax=Sphingobium aromaticiconvertens TaxID=365341 RepID=UPI00301A034D
MRFLWSHSYWAAFLRFAINGGGVALVAVATYCLCAIILGWAPLLANFVAYLTQLVLGYQMHRVYSFRQSDAHFPGIVRYLVMSVAAFALNSLWVWLLTGLLGWANWTPIIMMVAATPVMTFVVARHWVFRAA